MWRLRSCHSWFIAVGLKSLTFLSDFCDKRLCCVSQKLHIPRLTFGDVLIDVDVSCKTGCIRIIWKIMFSAWQIQMHFCAII